VPESEGWFIVLAAAQAVAALVIAIYTRSLSRFTEDYVAEMRRLNDLQAQANALQHAAMAQQVGRNAPSLAVVPAGRTHSDRAEARFEVRNVGGSTASDALVKTEWGDTQTGRTLAPGETLTVSVSCARADVGVRPTHPAVEFASFRDPMGDFWEQLPGSPPVRKDVER
jgi:hypothetical protein